MRALIIVSSIYLFSCNSVNHRIPVKNNINILGNTDGINRVDSIKWIFYSLNYLGKALFYDSLQKADIKLEPIACDIVLDNYGQVGNDSSYYFFSFNRPRHTFRYVDISSADGVGVYKNNICPIVSHGRYDFQDNQDSINTFLARADSGFRRYLGSYSGELSPWLKQEALRRRSISQ